MYSIFFPPFQWIYWRGWQWEILAICWHCERAHRLQAWRYMSLNHLPPFTSYFASNLSHSDPRQSLSAHTTAWSLKRPTSSSRNFKWTCWNSLLRCASTRQLFTPSSRYGVITNYKCVKSKTFWYVFGSHINYCRIIHARDKYNHTICMTSMVNYIFFEQLFCMQAWVHNPGLLPSLLTIALALLRRYFQKHWVKYSTWNWIVQQLSRMMQQYYFQYSQAFRCPTHHVKC